MGSEQPGSDPTRSALSGIPHEASLHRVAVRDPSAKSDHIVGRLRWRIQDATQLGFHVRSEPLEGRHADWCQIGKRKLIFLDLSVPAAEQLRQLECVLADYHSAQTTQDAAASRAA